MKGSGHLVFIGAAILMAIIVCILFWIFAIIGAMDMSDGCFHRYGQGGSGGRSDTVTNTISLRGDANYTGKTDGRFSGPNRNGRVILDPASYGKWVNTNLRVKGDQEIKFNIKGEISLCKAYIPVNNLQGKRNTDPKGKIIEIPRVEDRAADPIRLIFDAKTPEWRNIAELFTDDKIVVSLMGEKTSRDSRVPDSFAERMILADCTEKKTKYSPICGKYTIWGDKSVYVDKCSFKKRCRVCGMKCVRRFLWWCLKWEDMYCSCYKNVTKDAPEDYWENKKYSFPSDQPSGRSIDFTKFDRDCTDKDDRKYINSNTYKNKRFFWFSANAASGLLYRFSAHANPSRARGTDRSFKYAQIEKDQSYLNGGTSNVIMNEIYTNNRKSYLQYRFQEEPNGKGFANNTGGYILEIKQTKCRRTNGNAITDTFAGRGVIQYVISEYGKDPNRGSGTSSASRLNPSPDGAVQITTPSDKEGYLWLKILNDPKDYKNSTGEYSVQFLTSTKTGEFHSILNIFFKNIRGKIKDASETIFKNMTCYRGIGGDDNCTNFFNYIKVLLTIYVMITSMMFLLGMIKITQTDFLIRIVKIGIVAGLINGDTFEFFNEYVFDFVTEFSDTMISNMAGYEPFLDTNGSSNPFMFLDEVMTRIFLSSTFAAQMMAMLSMGFSGFMYFILVFVAIAVVIMVSFRAITVYLMAFMAIAVLIGIAPLFLTFMLFERTWYLFDNWVRFTFRYMVEPVIMLAGIIILMQLFTIFFDYVVGYSVCWKCAIPIKLPFSAVTGLSASFLDIELFCFNWFAPWGVDHRSGQVGLSLQNVIILLILSYCLWGYINFSAKISARLVAKSGGPSAVNMGNSMSSGIGQAALSKVGLDQKSRTDIKKGEKARRQSMSQGEKLNKRSKTTGRGNSGGSNSGGAAPAEDDN